MQNESIHPPVSESPPRNTESETVSQGDPAADGYKAGGHRQPQASRALYLHPSDRMLGGVCGGLAEYINLDPGLVRVFWLAATVLTGGGGLLAYGALWLLLPVGTAENGQQKPAAIELNDRNMARVAFLLIGLGILWLLANLGILPSLWSGFWGLMRIFFWPAILMGAGYLLLRGQRAPGRAFDFQARASELGSRLRQGAPDRAQVKSGMQKAQQRIPIRRSRTDRMFLGVCGGLGRTLSIDANLVRLIWAAFSIGSLGTGVLVYVLVGLVLPEEPSGTSTFEPQGREIQVIDGTANSSA